MVNGQDGSLGSARPSIVGFDSASETAGGVHLPALSARLVSLAVWVCLLGVSSFAPHLSQTPLPYLAAPSFELSICIPAPLSQSQLNPPDAIDLIS